MSDRYDEWVTVVPGPGRLRETAAQLLAIAMDPRLVRTDGNGTEFLVHPLVAEQFTNPEVPPAPPKRRPRAKKESETS